MITFKLIFRPDWMCWPPHFAFNKRFWAIDLSFIELSIQWGE